VEAPAEGDETASLTSYFNGDSDCTDSVSSISLYYHLWAPDGDLCRGTLQIQQQVDNTWTTVATASEFQVHHIPYTIYHIPYTIYHIPYTIYHIPYKHIKPTICSGCALKP
jgi:hypothetical protein